MDWTHEKGSVMMFEKLVNDNNIDFLENEDVKMIRDLILGERQGYQYGKNIN